MAEQVGSTPGTSTGSDYLAARQLKAGSASWVLLAGLGVAYVISGDYAGWHFGLAQGGWGGLAIAAVLMAVMYAAWCSASPRCPRRCRPRAAATPSPASRMGPWGGFATGAAILLEYAVAPAAIATFIGGYVESLGLFGITDGWWVYLACYVLFVGIHLLGVGEALKAMFVIAAVAVVGLVALRDRRDRVLRRRQPHRHPRHRRRRRLAVPAVRPGRGVGELPVRDLVLPRRRGRAARRRGGARPRAGDAARDHRRDGDRCSCLRGR